MIRRSVTIPAAPDRVWDALTDPQKLPGWFGGELQWVPEAGTPLFFHGSDGETREGRVEEVRLGRYLRFVWWPAGGEQAGVEASEVAYLLEPSGDGTRLTVQEKTVEPSGPGFVTSAVQGWDAWDDRLAGAWADLSVRNRIRARA